MKLTRSYLRRMVIEEVKKATDEPFAHEHPSTVERQEDAWAGGQNVHNDVDWDKVNSKKIKSKSTKWGSGENLERKQNWMKAGSIAEIMQLECPEGMEGAVAGPSDEVMTAPGQSMPCPVMTAEMIRSSGASETDILDWIGILLSELSGEGSDMLMEPEQIGAAPMAAPLPELIPQDLDGGGCG